MIELSNNNGVIQIKTSNKSSIFLDTGSKKVHIDSMDVGHPGEFEKSGILLEVKEFSDILFYSFTVDGKHIVIITDENFELKEEILSFFPDVDILIITGSKESAKIFENIEARVVVPYGEGKHTFLTTLGQHTEEVDTYKLKGETSLDSTEFVNLK